ncbi:hypothetical protein ACE7GA_09285 [Roseomonas sp. CCTCC AB2023176]|uniref:hypothetical protein n=1 Tax=Roseomonas sp. CCTCC AB2023176 TaxID=3342640 RepID=UPI0035D97175
MTDDTIRDAPPRDTTSGAPPRDATRDAPPRDATRDAPPRDATRERDPRASHHDLGGHPRFVCTAVDIEDDAPNDAFGKRVDAIRLALGAAGLMTVDEMRRGIESIPEEEYHALTYYERWLRAISGVMVEKGIIPAADLSPGGAP